MQLPQPFIQLPVQFDSNALASELAQLPDSAWMNHPSGLQGNSAAALISRNGGDNHDFNGRMVATPHLQQSPYITQVMTSFNEVLGRSRLMKLEPGCEVATHVDFNYHWLNRVRVHIPIITEPEVTFWCGDAKIHMSAGECWIFDSWRRHRVTHGGHQPRIHLVIDLAGSSRFWRMVKQAATSQLQAFQPQAAPQPLTPVTALTQETSQKLRTEQFNTSPVMAPGEVDSLVEQLLLDVSSQSANATNTLQHYKAILEDFKHDWREVWHEYGPNASGIIAYRQILQTLTSKLIANPRALTTFSNDVGINPIIMQRIVRAALVEDLF